MFNDQKIQELNENNLNIGKVMMDEVASVDYDTVLDESEFFYVKPAIVTERSGQKIAVYGIYNKTTGVREAETRQLGGAQEWLKVLTANAKGEELPGLDMEDEAPETLQ